MENQRTPASLFEEISQDNEVLREFKHHSLRVMHLSVLLSKRLECYEEDLRTAALLHDIGKMALSKDILLKPGKLNSIERTVVESHCHIGNLIVRKELGQPRAAEFIRDHHENWDGTGYPRRLTGEDITLQGRIIRICDAFDVMTYDVRKYNMVKMSYAEAFEELRNCSWSQFDGNLVEVFISGVKEAGLAEDWYEKMETSLGNDLF
ncbi:HD-GYP domain-containing protein [Virgibacillus xinjiangensis]|uniref:HD-GYP domain-containing protein n=1 Tax=Virgibacillus xinjiangensis TaxID=393090 RepID=A0ABV7CY43_9BACI